MRISIVMFMFFLMSSIQGQEISVFDDFEGNGTIDSWYGDACSLNTSLANPVQEGINTSATVLEYHDQGGQYANIRFDVADNFDLTEKHTFTIKLYVASSSLVGPQTNQVSLKLQDGTLGQPWSTQSEIIKTIVVDQWQEISFDFANDNYINLDDSSPAPTERSDFNRVLIQINGENNNSQVRAYIDDVSYDGTITGPPSFNTLIWSDEFDGSSDLDLDKWYRQYILPNGWGWFNGELQHYTNREDNSFVEDGILHVLAKKETFTDQGVTKDYTSARLNSKFAFTYGKVEVRAKLPTGAGTWPAIWMLGKNITENGGYWSNEGFGTTPWPACGEIDIMEHWGTNQNFVQSATHTPSSFGATVNHGGQVISTVSTQFHVYALEWTAEKLRFTVDGVHHYTYNPADKNAETWPFDEDMYLLLNVAINPQITSAFNQGAMEIDYVRVYQQGPVNTSSSKEQIDLKAYPNPVVDLINIEADLEGDLLIQIFDMKGNLMRSRSLSQSKETLSIDGLDDLPAGNYILKCISKDKIGTLSFVKL